MRSSICLQRLTTSAARCVLAQKQALAAPLPARDVCSPACSFLALYMLAMRAPQVEVEVGGARKLEHTGVKVELIGLIGARLPQTTFS